MRTVSDGSRLMARLKNLPKIVLGEDDGILLLSRVQGGVSNVEQVGPNRKVRPVFLEDSEWQQARAARPVYSLYKIMCREFLPMSGEFRLAPHRGRTEDPDQHNQPSAHVLPSGAKF